MVLALVGLLAVLPIGLTAFHGYHLHTPQNTLEFRSYCSALLSTFVSVYLCARGAVSLIVRMPRRSAQLGLLPVQRHVAARWPTFGRVTGLVSIPGID